MDEHPEATDKEVTRRHLLWAGAAGVLGTAAATLPATPASANDGDPLILGQDNVQFSTTHLDIDDTGDSLEIGSASGVLRVDSGFGAFGISVTALSGTGVNASGEANGVIGGGYTGKGVWGIGTQGIGVYGWSELGTGVKAEAQEILNEGAIAFEAVGPVKFSTSGLADLAVSHDRVTVNPGVPITDQSKVLATLQGDAGGKAFVERVELDSADGTFDVVLTKPAAHPVQVAWFLIS
jgi:hypothetical protein